MLRTFVCRLGTLLRPPATPPSELVEPSRLVERGSFAYATCPECGWQGPGRRARALTASDADLHALVCGLSADYVQLIETTAAMRQEPARRARQPSR